MSRWKITKLETFLVRSRSLFLKIHIDEGLIGLVELVLHNIPSYIAPAGLSNPAGKAWI